jgi:hypothetical protein
VDEQELKELLNDDEGRLEASLELLKKGGMETLEDVLVATDLMDDDELERLSEQLAESAPRLETALINCLELPNPTIAYLCSFALASIPSSKALPSLFLAIQDGERTPDPVLFAETLFPYGEDLIDALIPALKDVETLGEDHPLAILAVEFGRTSEAALERLEKEIPELTSAL